MVWAMASPSDLETIDRLAGEIRAESPELSEWLSAYAANHRNRLAEDLSIVRRELPTGRLLDVGAVPPFLMAALTESGREVAGVDVDPSRFATCVESLGLDLRKCDIEREALPFEDASFDGLIFNEVFEHLRIDLNFTMGELARVLRPGGRMVLSTPNMRSARGIIALLLRGRSAFLCPDVHEQYDKLRTIGHMGHVREYTRTDVTDLCEKLGFIYERVIWRNAARMSLPERALCAVEPALRPYMTIILVRAGTM